MTDAYMADPASRSESEKEAQKLKNQLAQLDALTSSQPYIETNLNTWLSLATKIGKLTTDERAKKKTNRVGGHPLVE